MRALGQAGLFAGSCNSGIDHGSVGFLFQSFSFNRCGLHTGFILENLTADRAGVVSIVALCRAGGFLGIGLGHRVMCFDNGIGQGNLGGAVLVGEVLVAYVAMPVGGIAVLGAGGSLGIGLGHRVTRGCNLFSLYRGFGLAIGILKDLAASGAGVILVVAILGAGGGLSVGLGQGVRNLVNDFLRNQNLITDGAMRTLGQACLCAGSRNSGINHGSVGFLFQSFSFNRCGLHTGFILENLTADRAGVVSIVALCRAGGFLGIGLGHRVMCFDNGIGQGNLGGAVLVGEVLVAYVAMPVGGIAILGAGGSLGIGLGQIMPSRNYPAIFGNFILARFIGEILAAGSAGPVGAATGFGAGGSFSFGFNQCMRCRNHPAIFGNFVVACFIGEELSAVGAAPVCAVTRFCTCGDLCIGFCQLVANGHTTVAYLEVNIGFFKIKNIIRIIGD